MIYLHGGDVFGKEIEMDFSVNVNPYGMPEVVSAAIKSSLKDCEGYPDYASRALCLALSIEYGVRQEQVICGNGAAGVLYDLVRTAAPSSGLVMAPTFLEYERAMAVCGAQVWHSCLLEEQNFDVGESFVEDILTNRPAMVFVCNPNNPTGRLIHESLLERILEACKKTESWLVIDESFLGFTPQPSFARHLAEYERLFIIGAFTKLYAMAGLRAGYGLCSDEGFLAQMMENRQSWEVSRLAQEASLAALWDGGYVQKTRALIAEERVRFSKKLAELGINIYEGTANFLLLYCEKDLYAACLKRHILVRDCSSFTGLKKGFCRVAVRRPEENDKLVAVLREIIDG